MWLTDADHLNVLMGDAKMKRIEIYKQTGMPTRSQTHELRRLSRRSHHHPGLRSKVREKVPTLMWDEPAENVIEDIDDLMEDSCWSDINRRYRFFIDSTRESFEAISARADEVLSKHEFGLVLVHCFFFAAMCFSKSGDFGTPEARQIFDRSRDLALRSLAPRTEAWAKILRSRLVSTAFALHWNQTPRDQRDSAEMRKRVEDSQLFETLEALNDLVPKSHRAPFSALAAASRFKMQEKYEDLYRRIVRAAPRFKDPHKLAEDPFFDNDFDDFRIWLSAKLSSVRKRR